MASVRTAHSVRTAPSPTIPPRDDDYEPFPFPRPSHPSDRAFEIGRQFGRCSEISEAPASYSPAERLAYASGFRIGQERSVETAGFFLDDDHDVCLECEDEGPFNSADEWPIDCRWDAVRYTIASE